MARSLPVRELRTSLGNASVENWVEQTATPLILNTSDISAAIAAQESSSLRRHAVDLDIPLDFEAEKSLNQKRQEARALKQHLAAEKIEDRIADAAPSGYASRHGGELRRRDSLKRREALLRGKEGSRRRQKWENDRLLGNPAFQYPEPQDWAPRPTHPVQNVPYVLAPLWDEHYAKISEKRAHRARLAAANETLSYVPRELRERLKRSKAAKNLLQDLEQQVRNFVQEWEEQEKLASEGWDVNMQNSDAGESSEEEIVFIGRRDQGKTGHRRSDGAVRRDRLIFDSLADDHGAGFGRWLVHSIAAYYKLHTWSVTTGNPARREAYVGIPASVEESKFHLPKPLWVMV